MTEEDFKTVSKICDVFLNHGVLKIGSIEGLSDIFPEVWAIMKERINNRDSNFKNWCIWWGSIIHGEHEQFYKKEFKDCPHTVCLSIYKTIGELRHEIGNGDERV